MRLLIPIGRGGASLESEEHGRWNFDGRGNDGQDVELDQELRPDR